METQDHKNPNQSGNDGHGGVHVCTKCEWAFPNSHPSSRHRRAHKRVCGTIEGYRLDNDARDKTQVDVEGDIGESNSDDELKTRSKNPLERTISRRSSSGVGSKSSGSTRSEEDVYTDAVTNLSESSTTLTRRSSSGVVERFYSMRNENELDDTEPAKETSGGAVNLSAPDLLKDNKLQTILRVEGENAVDENMIQSSETSRELDIVSERGKEIISNKDESDVRTSSNGTPEEVVEEVTIRKGASDEVKVVSDDVLDSVSAGGLMKAALIETDGVEDSHKSFNDVDFSEKDKIEGCNAVNSPGNLYYPGLQIQDIESIDSNNIRKSDLIEECDSKIGNLDHNGSKANFSEATNFSDESVEYSKACVVDEGGTDIDFSKTSDNSRVYSEDVDVSSLGDKQEDSNKYVDGQNTFQKPDQTSNVGINILRSEAVEDMKNKVSEEEKDITKEKKPITSLENIDGVTMDAGCIQETISNRDFNVKGDEEHFTVLDDDGSKVSENNFAVRNSLFAEPAIDEVPTQDLELINNPNNSGMGNVDNITVEAAILNGKEMSVGGSYDSVDYSKETDENVDHGVLDKLPKSGDIKAGHSQGESLRTSQCGGKIESTGENAQSEECKNDDGTTAIRINDDHLNQGFSEKFTEKTSCMTEGDGVIKQHVTVPAVDTIVDSGSQADSLDGNWGSVSVLSTTSDAQPTTDTVASNRPRALVGEGSPSMVPKPVMENQPSQNKMSIQTDVGIEQMEGASEIQESKEQQHFPTVADVANEPDRGNKDKEIIAKVANWNSGKLHTPLKTLLGEAIATSRPESPIHHNQTDVIPGTNTGFSGKTENVNLNPDQPEMEVAQEEMGKEWNSPARYPVNIKTEKKRSKSKPYWAPFLCCSSVNAR